MTDPAPSSFIWSLRSAEMPVAGSIYGGTHHSFLLIVDETSSHSPAIIDELHFKPTPKQALLGAERYTNPKRNLDTLQTKSYERGSSLLILKLWNNALHMGLQIDGLRLPFSPTHNCRASAKATLAMIGYPFETFDAPGMQRGLQTDLTPFLAPAAIDDQRSPQTVYAELKARYQDLRQSRRPVRPRRPDVRTSRSTACAPGQP